MKTPPVNAKLTLRLPPKLHRSLKAVAVDDGRSLNAEIVQRLLSMNHDPGLLLDGIADHAKVVEALETDDQSSASANASTRSLRRDNDRLLA
jgi:hypothetical protein